ncbi:hypothetical protein GCM10022254_50270 [Actinomadura meridiana]|uniref:Uncharacterized protein n=1 Tax=Actinomadura meridiana TaxID=559626 RepID=A0ABP8CCJ6_9ACTN
MLGYAGYPDWRDMSEYLVHLTDEFAMNAILRQRAIKAMKAFGAATNVAGLGDSQQAACLSEIPLDRLDRLVERHGEWGLGFLKSYIRCRNGGPVWYTHRDSDLAEAVFQTVRQAMCGGVDPEDPLWKLTPFIDKTGAWDGGRYEFEWEREWRVLGDLEFFVGDVEFLIIPEVQQASMQAWWDRNFGEMMPPVIDITWEMGRLQAALIDYKLSEDEAA